MVTSEMAAETFPRMIGLASTVSIDASAARISEQGRGRGIRYPSRLKFRGPLGGSSKAISDSDQGEGTNSILPLFLA